MLKILKLLHTKEGFSLSGFHFVLTHAPLPSLALLPELAVPFLPSNRPSWASMPHIFCRPLLFSLAPSRLSVFSSHSLLHTLTVILLNYLSWHAHTPPPIQVTLQNYLFWAWVSSSVTALEAVTFWEWLLYMMQTKVSCKSHLYSQHSTIYTSRVKKGHTSKVFPSSSCLQSQRPATLGKTFFYRVV